MHFQKNLLINELQSSDGQEHFAFEEVPMQYTVKQKMQSPKDHKEGVKELRQILQGFVKSKLSKLDYTLLKGIYDTDPD